MMVSLGNRKQFGETMTEMKGTPITRNVGGVIRVGWRAFGYSVDRKVANKYRTVRAFLFILALVVGVAVAAGVDYVFYAFFASHVAKFVPIVRDSPEIVRLCIYGLTLVLGALIYLQIIAAVGRGMVKGIEPFDEGYGLYEQRQRSAMKRGIHILGLIAVLLVLVFAPIEMSLSVQILSFGVVIGLLLEGLYFRILRPEKFKPQRQR